MSSVKNDCPTSYSSGEPAELIEMTTEIYPYGREGAWSSAHNSYYAYAYRSYNDYCIFLKEIKDKESSLKIKHAYLNPEELDSLIMFEARHIYSEAYRVAISSALFACMCIEAFLNYYGVKRLGERFYKRFIERLGITEKIAVLVLTCHQRVIERDSVILKKARKMFEERNGLVHPKTREIHVNKVEEFIYKHPNEFPLKDLLDDMEIIIDELCKLDSDIHREFEFTKQT